MRPRLWPASFETPAPRAPQDEGLAVASARDTVPRSRGMICPSFGLGSPRREGAGNAGCTLHPRSRVQWVEGSAHEHTGSAEALRHSLRNGFTAYTCSPRRRIPFCHRRQRIEICLSPVGPTRLRWLDISHGCQNHTTSPYAAPSPATPTGEMPTEVKGEGLETPVVCANVGSLTGEPALQPRSRPTPLRPSHPTPRP
jgi:hypothetical protein